MRNVAMRRQDGSLLTKAVVSSRFIALTAVFASVYYVATALIAPIAFLEVQCRLSDSMYALLPLFGWPLIIGTTIANFFGNLSSPIGVLDWISPFIFILPQVAVWKLGVKALPILIGTISVWVGFILHVTFGVPLVAIGWIFIGEAIAEIGLGVPLYYALKRRLLKNEQVD